MKSKITLSIILLGCFCLSSAFAQRTKGVAGFVKMGYTAASNADNTFRKISPNGISDYSNNFCLIGGDLYFRTGKIILGLEGHIGAQGDKSNGRYHTEPFVGAGHARFGYIVMETSRYWIYPSIGSGTSYLILTDYIKDGDESENEHNKILMGSSFDIGLNGDFIVAPNPGDRQRYGAFLVGVRTGYRAGFRSNNWFDEDGDDLNNMPSYSNNAFYISIAVGGGWFYKKQL